RSPRTRPGTGSWTRRWRPMTGRSPPRQEDADVARVRGVDHRGRILAEDVVPHGIDPAAVLQALGHGPVWTGSEVVDGELVLVYRVRQGDRPQPHQRLSAYAVVQASF